MPDTDQLTTGLQRRELPITLHTRAADDDAEDKREVSGIGVPYGETIEFWGIREEFAPGSVEVDGDVLLFWQHASPIGLVTDHRSDDAGWHYDARISQTATGDEAYTLAQDGVITRSSIGFEPVEHIETKDDDGTVTIRHTKVIVREVSLVPFPAYDGARLAEVRHRPDPTTQEGQTMPETITPEDLSEVRESVEDLTRTVELLRDEHRDEPEPIETRSIGQLLKDFVRGDESAAEHLNAIHARAFEGGTTGDSVVKAGWVGDLTRLIDEVSPLPGLFSTGTLPSEGNVIEYAQLKSNTVTVDKQANEGDDLTHGKVELETKTAPVETFGGHTSLTRQVIERSSVNYLNHTFRAMAIAAGRYRAATFRAHYAAAVTAQRTAGNVVDVPADTTDYADWLDAVVDAAIKYEELGLALDGLIVDKTYFKAFNRFTGQDGRPMFTVSGTGANTVGSLNVKTLRGDLASVPVYLNAKQTTAGGAFFNRLAIRSYRSGLARLQDDNIVNLSRSFSVYGYQALADEIPAGIVPVRRTTTGG